MSFEPKGFEPKGFEPKGFEPKGFEPECVVPAGNRLGEGPLWDPRSRRLWWADILAGELHSYDPTADRHQTLPQANPVTSLGLREGGMVASLWDRFAYLDMEGRVVQTFAEVEERHPNARFNDGKVGPDGSFWAGTMDQDLEGERGELYRFDGRSSRIVDRGYRVTNGPAFSPDGHTLYHTDTLKRDIYAFDIKPGALPNKKRLHIQIPEDWGKPDGMTVDSNGNLYVCHFGGSRITRFRPDGRKIDHIPFPVSCVTSCAFGGDDLATLYVTTAAVTVMEEGRQEQEPLAGALFQLNVEARGLPSPIFQPPV